MSTCLELFCYQIGQSTWLCQPTLGISNSALQVGRQAEGLPKATVPGSEQSKELVELTALLASIAVCCALGVLA